MNNRTSPFFNLHIVVNCLVMDIFIDNVIEDDREIRGDVYLKGGGGMSFHS